MDPAPVPFTTASIFYRERARRGMSLGFSLDYVRREYHIKYGDGGLGFGRSGDLLIKADVLYISFLPEVKLDPQHMVTLRFGFQFGQGLGATKSGVESTWGLGNGGYYSTRTTYERTSFRGGDDLRGLLSARLLAPCKKKGSVVVDLFVSSSFSSLLRKGVQPGSVDLGLRLGIALRADGRSLGRIIGDAIPEAPDTTW
jgi:hypothetical protein